MTRQCHLMLVAGARPNFMKVAPLMREGNRRSGEFRQTLVHTGQHYDEGMSDVFFRELDIPAPAHHLNVGSGSHAQQTAAIMQTFEPVLLEEDPDCVLVFGDVNSTLACSIVAKKLNYQVAHVEAGLRSGDWTMPEEINRIVTDSISDYYFVTEPSGLEHLAAEGKDESRIHYVGHVMIDNLLFEVQRLEQSGGTRAGKEVRYGVITMHRPSNVDDEETLRGIVGAFEEIGRDLPLFFSIHPRTRASLERFGLSLPESVTAMEPLGYRDFLDLWRNADLVLTDSGGLQEETTGLGVPCLTLRENTERPVTIAEGTNRLVGVDPATIVAAAREVLASGGHGGSVRRPELWDGRASERILDVLARAFG